MRYLLSAAGVATLALVTLVAFQYSAALSTARQRVLSGSQVLSTERGAIEYAVRGEGAPVLLLHGAGGGYDQGLLIGKTILGSGFREIAVSRFGYLRSPMPADPSLAAQAALYAALLDHLGVDRVIVAAMSAGGPSALQFAHDYPERTSALVLFSAATEFRPPQVSMPMKIVGSTVLRSDLAFWLAAKSFKAQFLELMGIPADAYESLSAEDKDLTQQMLDAMYPIGVRSVGTSHEAGVRPLDGASLTEISAPTLILHARDDKFVPYQHAEHAHRYLKASRLILFETGGHSLLLRLRSVREHVSGFLNATALAADGSGPSGLD